MSQGAVAESYGWSGNGANRDVDPCYTPDMAELIDGPEDDLETDFTVAGELLREIFAFAFAYRGDQPQPNLHTAFRRFVCIVWLTSPDLLGNASLMQLGPELGCTRANLSKLIRDFGDRFGGLRNRLQKTESARQIYSEAQKRDHWRNRKKQTPVAPCGTTGAHAHHSKNGTNHSEGST